MDNNMMMPTGAPSDIMTDYQSALRRQRLMDAMLQSSMQPRQAQQVKGRFEVPMGFGAPLAQVATAMLAQKGVQNADESMKDVGKRYKEGLASEVENYDKLRSGGTYNRPDMTGAGMTGGLDEQDVPRKVETEAANPRKAIMMAMASQFPELKQFAAMDYKALNETPYSKIDPTKYTPESLQKFAASGGRDYTALVPLVKHEMVNAGDRTVPVNPYAPPPNIPTAVSPNTVATQAGLNDRYNRVSGNVQAQLAQADRHWNGLSANQRKDWEMAAAKLGIDVKELWFKSGIWDTGAAATAASPPPTGAPAPFAAPSPPMQIPPGATPPIVPQQPPTQPGAPSLAPIPPQVQKVRDNDRIGLLRQEMAQQQAQGRVDPALQQELALAERQMGVAPTAAPAAAPAPMPTPQPTPQPAPAPPVVPPGPTPTTRAKWESEKPQETFAARSTLDGLDRVNRTIDKLKAMPGLAHITGPVAGRTPSISDQGVNAQAELDTLKSQISVQELQRMREASKTGGAVGQVTEKEWPRLEAQLGALAQSQTTSAFKANLEEVQRTIARMSGNVKGAYKDRYGEIDWTPQNPNEGKIRGIPPPPPGFKVN